MGDKVVICVLNADGTIRLGSTSYSLQTLVTVMYNDCKNMGLQVKANKTKVGK